MEQRKYPRVCARSVPLDYRHRDQLYRATSAEDLSLGGACLLVDTLLPVGALMAVTVYDGNPGRALRLAAKVVAVGHRPKVMRIAFEWMPDSARERLQALVSRLVEALSAPPITVHKEMMTAREAMFDFRPIPLSPADHPVEATVSAAAPPPRPDHELAKLKVQLHGLLLQLSEANDELARRQREIIKLTAELEQWRSGDVPRRTVEPDGAQA